MPLEGQQLIIDPFYPSASKMMNIGLAKTKEEVEPSREYVNRFWSWKWRSDVYIWKQDGRYKWGLVPATNHLNYDFETLRSVEAWSLETESTALTTLRSLVSHHQFRQWVLTGMFIESSKKSGISYIFRRLKPTVALHADKEGMMKILCCLCLHPVGYYKDSWAGCLCPTDDAIAHLMLMRGDEHMLWRRANQHAAFRPEAGL